MEHLVRLAKFVRISSGTASGCTLFCVFVLYFTVFLYRKSGQFFRSGSKRSSKCFLAVFVVLDSSLLQVFSSYSLCKVISPGLQSLVFCEVIIGSILDRIGLFTLQSLISSQTFMFSRFVYTIQTNQLGHVCSGSQSLVVLIGVSCCDEDPPSVLKSCLSMFRSHPSMFQSRQSMFRSTTAYGLSQVNDISIKGSFISQVRLLETLVRQW